jgi:hypothetical protein
MRGTDRAVDSKREEESNFENTNAFGIDFSSKILSGTLAKAHNRQLLPTTVLEEFLANLKEVYQKRRLLERGSVRLYGKTKGYFAKS